MMLGVRPPTGTITLMFTDIEGSTKLWEAFPGSMREALARHDAILRQVIAESHGYVFKTVGDAFCAAFATAPDAVQAVLAAQLALAREPWPEETPIKVRMALHTGAVSSRDDDYFGPPLNRVARLLATGHGGQVLLSQTTYELTRDVLPPNSACREMGEHRLKDLGRPEVIFQLLHPDLSANFPPLKSLDSPELKHNLPQQMTSFIGREKEISEIEALLGKTRLLTVTGAGGSGKTRLILQVAADQLDAYQDGAWFVELASISESSQVPQTVAGILGLKEDPAIPITQMLCENLRAKRLLLILDNCEHLLDGCARLADTLIRQCPGVQILASSREGLGINGEQAYRVPSLLLPNPAQVHTVQALSQFEAVQLFIERATLAQPTFQVTNENAPALASLCNQLDGIPLAIELAAARVRSLSVEEIDGKLDQRFRLLTGGPRTALPRQQTLRALVGWSYDLLTEMEREAFEQLSVFVGGWTMDMAEQTCGDPILEFDLLDLITALVDKSLINFESREDGHYSFYESLRQFAREQLAARPEAESAVLERHARTMTDFGMERVRKLRTTAEPAALRQLVKYSPNITAALAWARQANDIPMVASLSLAIAATDQRRGYPRDGSGLIDEVLGTIGAAESVPAELYARLLFERATLALDVLENDDAAPFAERGLDIANKLNQTELLIRGENLLGQVAMAKGDFELTRTHYNRALKLSEQAKNWVEMARLQNNLGIVERRDPNGDKDLAAEHYRAALGIQRTHRHSRGEAETLNSLGVLEQSRGNLVEAASLYLEAARIETQLDHTFGVAKTLSNYGEAMAELGQHDKAIRPFGIAVHLFGQIRSPYRDYTIKMLQQSATQLGWTAEQTQSFTNEWSTLELRNAVTASLQE